MSKSWSESRNGKACDLLRQKPMTLPELQAALGVTRYESVNTLSSLIRMKIVKKVGFRLRDQRGKGGPATTSVWSLA